MCFCILVWNCVLFQLLVHCRYSCQRYNNLRYCRLLIHSQSAQQLSHSAFYILLITKVIQSKIVNWHLLSMLVRKKIRALARRHYWTGLNYGPQRRFCVKLQPRWRNQWQGCVLWALSASNQHSSHLPPSLPSWRTQLEERTLTSSPLQSPGLSLK